MAPFRTKGEIMIPGTRNADAPLIITYRRNNVVPTASVLIIRNNDDAVFPDRTVLHSRDEVGDMLLACDDIGVAGVLVVLADRLHEAHWRQVARGDIGQELCLILQMRVGASGRRVQRGRSLARVIRRGRRGEW